MSTFLFCWICLLSFLWLQPVCGIFKPRSLKHWSKPPSIDFPSVRPPSWFDMNQSEYDQRTSMPRPNPSIANMYQDSYSRSWISSTKRKANAKVEEQIDTHIAEIGPNSYVPIDDRNNFEEEQDSYPRRPPPPPPRPLPGRNVDYPNRERDYDSSSRGQIISTNHYGQQPSSVPNYPNRSSRNTQANRRDEYNDRYQPKERYPPNDRYPQKDRYPPRSNRNDRQYEADPDFIKRNLGDVNFEEFEKPVFRKNEFKDLFNTKIPYDF